MEIGEARVWSRRVTQRGLSCGDTTKMTRGRGLRAERWACYLEGFSRRSLRLKEGLKEESWGVV